MKNLITEKEAARMLCIHPDTLKARRHRGEAPRHINLSTSGKPVIRYAPADVLAFIEARRTSAREMEDANV